MYAEIHTDSVEIIIDVLLLSFIRPGVGSASLICTYDRNALLHIPLRLMLCTMTKEDNNYIIFTE